MIAGNPQSNSPIRIATVYSDRFFRGFRACDMSLVRWLRISEALAEAGYQVDIIINLEGEFPIQVPNLGRVSYADVDWEDYQVVKTLFHLGFQSLINANAQRHPFIISKLGSVVGEDEETPGVFFHGEEHEELLRIQRRIAESAKYVSILTRESEALWRAQHGSETRILHVPTGVDCELPRPGANPYCHLDQRVAVYIGNIYGETQRDINLLWQNKLNNLGRELAQYAIRLCLVGPGDTSALDPALVTYMGAVDQEAIWDYFYYADVGVSLAQGSQQHNESSKLYYYLRTGLPVVSESPIPNNWLIEESGLGYVVPYNDPESMAESIHRASGRKWNYEEAIRYMKTHHTWGHRIAVYKEVIDSSFAIGA